MEKQKLYLLMQAFPIKPRETSFISPELPYLKENFDVTVVPLEQCSHSLAARAAALAKSLFSPMPYKQAAQGAKQGKNPIKVFAFSLFVLWRAKTYAAYLEKNVFTAKNAIVYGYWYNEIVLSGLLNKKRHPDYKYITRCHGYDVYDFRVPGGLQPYKEFMDGRLDKIVFACEHAKRYYLDRYNKADADKYPVFHLGVPQKPQKQLKCTDTLNIISCSAVIPLKRVNLIVEALALTEDIKISWHHFGSGTEAETIAKLAKDKLHDNVSYTLHGFVPNDEYIKMLCEMDADVFITASATEGGVPVSISEAASFGMPIIATDVGGIPEIVGYDNGILLCADTTAEDIAAAIRRFYALPAQQRQAMGDCSYHKWSQQFDSDKNSVNFINFLKQL